MDCPFWAALSFPKYPFRRSYVHREGSVSWHPVKAYHGRKTHKLMHDGVGSGFDSCGFEVDCEGGLPSSVPGS